MLATILLTLFNCRTGIIFPHNHINTIPFKFNTSDLCSKGSPLRKKLQMEYPSAFPPIQRSLPQRLARHNLQVVISVMLKHITANMEEMFPKMQSFLKRKHQKFCPQPSILWITWVLDFGLAVEHVQVRKVMGDLTKPRCVQLQRFSDPFNYSHKTFFFNLLPCLLPIPLPFFQFSTRIIL